MSSFFRTLSKVLRIGKARYIVGHDLAGNTYLELPSLTGSTDPRHTRRMIQWKENKYAGDYDQRSLPVQWTMWLRHTRREAPSIQELELDLQRQQITQHNARILAIKDDEWRQQQQQARMLEHQDAKARAQQQISSSSSPGGVPTSTVQDSQAEAEKESRVAQETKSDSQIFSQERIPDNDVWAASRARLAEKGQLPAQQQQQQQSATPVRDQLELAQQRRAAKRASLNQQDSELERARREMSKSPLDAFVPAPKPRS